MMTRKKRIHKKDDTKTNIIIVDDHPIVRQGLADLVNHEEDLLVCGQAEDAHQATPQQVRFDIEIEQTLNCLAGTPGMK